MRKIVIYICILIILGCAVYYIGEKTGHPVSELWEYAGEKISDHNILSGSVPADKRYESLKREYTFGRAMYPYLYMLSERGQKAYYIIYDGVSKCEKSIKLGDDIGVDRIEIMTVVTAVYNDHPELFWMDSAARYTYEERSGITSAQPKRHSKPMQTRYYLMQKNSVITACLPRRFIFTTACARYVIMMSRLRITRVRTAVL